MKSDEAVMSDELIGVFHDSLDRCTSQEDFLARFYRLLLESDEEIAEKFANTDMAQQAVFLKASIFMMLLAAEGRLEGKAHLQRISELHSRRHLNVRPELYDIWLECLIQAVSEFDPWFSPEIETAWRRMMSKGIEFMKSRY